MARSAAEGILVSGNSDYGAPMSDPDCPTCGVTMDEGFMIDRGHANAPSQSQWVEGIPERSWWQGIRLKGKERIPTVTYRCPRCGLLQSYARVT